jgi:hypothetical protein
MTTIGTLLLIGILLEVSILLVHWRTNDDYQKAIKYVDDSKTLRVLIYDKLEKQGSITMEDWIEAVKDAHDLW